MNFTPQGTKPEILWAQTAIPGSHPTWIKDTDPSRDLRPGEIAVPAHLGSIDFSDKLGQEIHPTYQSKTRPGYVEGMPTTLTIKAIYDDSKANNDGPEAVYAHADDVDSWAAANLGMSVEEYSNQSRIRAYAMIDDSYEAEAVQKELQSRGFSAISESRALAAIQPLFGLLNKLGIVLILFFVALCFASGIQFGTLITLLRGKMIAVARVFGHSRTRIMVGIMAESILIGMTVSVLTFLIGCTITALTTVIWGGQELWGFAVSSNFVFPGLIPILICTIVPVLCALLGAFLKARKTIFMRSPFEIIRHEG